MTGRRRVAGVVLTVAAVALATAGTVGPASGAAKAPGTVAPGRAVPARTDRSAFRRATTTAMPVVNAIPQVCSAPPGIVNHLDLPFVKRAHLFR
jgi:hypothetical protein